MLEKVFKLKENHTDVKTEILAGITTFMTMAYILAVNPSILSAAGMDQGAVFTATALASLIGTLCMAAFANYPFALAPGMGLNAYFAYTVVIGMNYSWQTALTAVFAEGIIFIILSLTNVREAIFNAIPTCLKTAVSVGIGLFIAFLGLQNANIVVGGSTLVQLFSVDAYNQANGVEASFNNVGITVLLAIIGVLITAIMVIKNIKGNILWGILITWILGIICQIAGLYVPNPEIGFYSLLPDFSSGLAIPSLAPVFGKLDFKNVFSLEFVVVVFAFLFVDLFEAPPLGFDVVILVGDIRVLHIRPITDALAHLLPLGLVFPDGLLALFDERLDAVFLDLRLAVQAEHLLDLQLHRQAMGIPAGLAQHVVALHRAIARDDVLDRARLHMADVRLAVGGRRAVEERKGGRALAQLHRFLKNVFVAPEFDDLFLALSEVHVG